MLSLRRMIWLLQPPPRKWSFFHSLHMCRLSSLLTGEGEGVGGAKSHNGEKAWSSIKHAILSAYHLLVSGCTANEGPVKIKYNCPIYVFPEWNCYFHNRIIMFCLLVPTLIYLWEIYIFPGSVCQFCCRKICGLILGIYKSLTDTWM
jgi:hypothetical protein